MGLFSKKGNDSVLEFSIDTIYKDGLNILYPSCPCKLVISDDQLLIITSTKNPPVATLQLKQITNIGFFMENEIIEKSRSVIGRSIAGGFVFGSVGAIVGGLSGTKDKQIKKSHGYVVVNFVPLNGTEPIAATFERTNPFDKIYVFINKVKQGAGLEQSAYKL